MSGIESAFGPGVTPDYAVIIQSDESLAKFEAYLRTHSLAPDASPATPSGRKEIKSRAYAVARHKTGLDEAGKALGDKFRVELNAINERRRVIKQKLEALQQDVSRPVDEWERQDKARTDMVHGILTRIDALSAVSIDNASSEVQARISELQKMEIEHSAFQELWDAAVSNRDKAVEMLILAFQRLRKQEEERAELDRLRSEAAERVATMEADCRRAEAEKAAAEATVERERLERQRVEAARAKAEEAARIAAEKAAEEALLREATLLEDQRRRADEALAERDRQHQAELSRIQKERDDFIALERCEREAALAREQARRDEDARRQADKGRRFIVMTAVGTAICQILEIDYDTAQGSLVKQLVCDMSEGRVPHIKMEF